MTYSFKQSLSWVWGCIWLRQTNVSPQQSRAAVTDIALAVILLLCVSAFREPPLAYSLLDMQINANECTSRFLSPANTCREYAQNWFSLRITLELLNMRMPITFRAHHPFSPPSENKSSPHLGMWKALVIHIEEGNRIICKYLSRKNILKSILFVAVFRGWSETW